ncbi:hypothetical protein L484_022949 [Morus notabilis]|uniref:Uncharacterized protein n=1 Tax=Morus notabilis TaxID=981085 RepID=W9R1E9_9ROSA|nr:hypothetical protein L484_022949 [Morus notabilis]
MQPNAAYINLMESETMEFTISVMTYSDSNNSSEVSSHVSFNERRASKRKRLAREMVAVGGFPNKGLPNELTPDTIPGGHGPEVRAADANLSDTVSASSSHIRVAKYSNAEADCSKVTTPDMGRSYIMSPKLAMIPAGTWQLQEMPPDMQRIEVNRHGMVDTPERLAHLMQWQRDMAGNRGLKNFCPDEDAPEEESSYKAFKRAAGGISARRAWHGPLIQRFEEESEPVNILSLDEHGNNFGIFSRLNGDPSEGAF